MKTFWKRTITGDEIWVYGYNIGNENAVFKID
jgi:hypothetical protein